jgi:TRAP-type C4-dicarboxylate transport system permease large subunit
MMLVNLCIGLITPPVGAVLFVGLSIGQTTMSKVIKPLLAFMLPMIIILLLVTYLEPITMFLPNLLYGK